MSLRMSALNPVLSWNLLRGICSSMEGYKWIWNRPAKLRSLRTPDMGLCRQQFLSSAVSQVWGGAPGLARLTSLDAAGLGPHGENRRFKWYLLAISTTRYNLGFLQLSVKFCITEEKLAFIQVVDVFGQGCRFGCQVLDPALVCQGPGTALSSYRKPQLSHLWAFPYLPHLGKTFIVRQCKGMDSSISI